LLRLFKIKLKSHNYYFFTKKGAKKMRDHLIADGTPTVVMRGPDHRLGESFNE
jgi:hypothetical protein